MALPDEKLLGDDYRLYAHTADPSVWATPVWTEITCIEDLGAPMNLTDVEIRCRGKDQIIHKRGRHADRRITFKLWQNPSDTFVAEINKLIYNDSTFGQRTTEHILVAISEGDITTTGHVYWMAEMQVISAEPDYSLDEGASWDIEMGVADTDNTPAFVTVS